MTLFAILRLFAICYYWNKTVGEDAVCIFKAMSEQTKLRLVSTTLLLLDELSDVSRRMFACLLQEAVPSLVWRRPPAESGRILGFHPAAACS